MMQSLITFIALAAAAQAFVARDGNCCFKLTGTGASSGPVGQLGDGQNRVGSNLPTGSYCINSSGGLTDGRGRGCILTPPTTQFQCDVGATPQSGFSVGCDGTLSYKGNSKFYGCDAGDKNGNNIYTTVTGAQTGCKELTLIADSCKANCPAPPPPAPPAPAPAPPKTCPVSLSGAYEFPHLIVPVSAANPNRAYGTSYFGSITPNDVSSIFNFDIPQSTQGKTCSLVFLFPKQSDLKTSSFTISGDGKVSFTSLSGVASQSTTFNNKPSVASRLGSFTLSPGNSYTVASFACPAGRAVSYGAESATTNFRYFQDYNPAPIGLYITIC